MRSLGSAADVRVLDDEVAADRHERRVGLELGLDVRLRVVRVEDHERAATLGAAAHVGDDLGSVEDRPRGT